MIQQMLDATRLFELVPNSIETHSSGKQSHNLQLTKLLLEIVGIYHTIKSTALALRLV